MEQLLTRIAWFVGLVLVQVLMLNNVCLFGLATPFVYVYFLLALDRDIDHNALMVLAFLIGLVVDIFSNTPGVNAGASVLVAFMRPSLLRLFSPRDEYENFEPGIYTLGLWGFVRYALVAVWVHHTALFLLEAFSWANIGHLAMRIICSTALTMTLVMAIEYVRHKR
ncbi:MAG: rod shape-determining protein MreD [Bacteroidaceae bacterium]|jgi:rod shape-determining protein MreD|nr:rod shape-determining protein MreD [Bacteroidaceae bacterium]